MNLQDEIDYGHMTLKQLSDLIESNAGQAAVLQLQLSWGFERKKMYGRIRADDMMLFEQIYEGKHVHQQIAQMHLDFQKQLSKIMAQRRRDLRPVRGGSEAGMSKGRQVGSNIDEKL
jgi:hypothetical protein